ncbi:hypothetical protein BDZ97DRAFT_816575 [Flammula alnicola]|nr:hypothetical protein BDZ97DRAFT_816575 [Flammula alnicola]
MNQKTKTTESACTCVVRRERTNHEKAKIGLITCVEGSLAIAGTTQKENDTRQKSRRQLELEVHWWSWLCPRGPAFLRLALGGLVASSSPNTSRKMKRKEDQRLDNEQPCRGEGNKTNSQDAPVSTATGLGRRRLDLLLMQFVAAVASVRLALEENLGQIAV